MPFQGENLNSASDESDVNVTIGTVNCNVTSLAMSQLVCIPPQYQPAPTDERGIFTYGGLPVVVVSSKIVYKKYSVCLFIKNCN